MQLLLSSIQFVQFCVARIRGKICVQSASMTKIISHFLLFCAFVPAGFDVFPQKTEVVTRHGRRSSGRLKVPLHQDAQKRWSIGKTPHPKKARRLPTILSQKEVAQLVQAARHFSIAKSVAVTMFQQQA
jgi:hypothetical protein